jgi:hypothetical protein
MEKDKTEYLWGSGGCGRFPTKNKDMSPSERGMKYLLPRRF